MLKERVLIDPAKITAISDVVRQKLNETTQYTLDELPDAIRRITKSGPHYTPEQIREFASRDMVINARIGYSRPSNDKNNIGTYNNYSRYGLGNRDSYVFLNAGILMSNTFTRHHNDGNRKIGLIRGVLSDGSFCVSILGTGKLLRQGSTSSPRPASRCNDFFIMGSSINCSFNVCVKRPDDSYQQTGFPNDLSTKLYIRSDNCSPWWGGSSFNAYVSYQFRRSAFFSTDNYQTGALSQNDALDFSPTWQPWGTSNILYNYLAPNYFINMFATLNGNPFASNAGSDIQFTTDKDTTLTIGNLEEQLDYTDLNSYFCPNDGKRYLCGNLYDDLMVEANKLINLLDGQSYTASELGSGARQYYTFDLADTLHGTYAAHNKLYNIILTHNEDEALRYIDDGTLPSDVIIYPFNVEDIDSNFNE